MPTEHPYEWAGGSPISGDLAWTADPVEGLTIDQMLEVREVAPKRWLGRLIGSCDVVRNPSLKSERNVSRRLTALQGEVAGADQMAHRAVADPNRQAPQPQAPPPAVCLHPLGSRRLETRYIWWVAIRQRIAAARYGVPRSRSSGR
jgi:hypothetical protein